MLACVGIGIAVYYAATLTNAVVAAGALVSARPLTEAIALTMPWGPLAMTGGAALYAIGFGLLFRFIWAATGSYRAAGWRDLRVALARYDGTSAPWRRRVPAAYFLGAEIVGASAGFPGLGWILSGRPLIGLPLALLGPGIAWAVIPLLASPYGDGPLVRFGNRSALLAYLAASTGLSLAGLGLTLARRGRRLPPGLAQGGTTDGLRARVAGDPNESGAGGAGRAAVRWRGARGGGARPSFLRHLGWGSTGRSSSRSLWSGPCHAGRARSPRRARAAFSADAARQGRYWHRSCDLSLVWCRWPPAKIGGVIATSRRQAVGRRAVERPTGRVGVENGAMEFGYLRFLTSPAFVIPWYAVEFVGACWTLYDSLVVNRHVQRPLKAAWPIIITFFSALGQALYVVTCRPPHIAARARSASASTTPTSRRSGRRWSARPSTASAAGLAS